MGKVCAELTDVAQATKARAAKIAQANLPLRLGSLAVIVIGIAVIGYGVQGPAQALNMRKLRNSSDLSRALTTTRTRPSR